MTANKLIGTAIGVILLALMDLKTWWDSPKDEDGNRQPFNFFVALPKWIVGALAGGEIGGGAE
jgi:hypothetical protein